VVTGKRSRGLKFFLSGLKGLGSGEFGGPVCNHRSVSRRGVLADQRWAGGVDSEKQG